MLVGESLVLGTRSFGPKSNTSDKFRSGEGKPRHYGGGFSNRSLSERVKAFREISYGRGRAPSMPKKI